MKTLMVLSTDKDTYWINLVHVRYLRKEDNHWVVSLSDGNWIEADEASGRRLQRVMEEYSAAV